MTAQIWRALVPEKILQTALGILLAMLIWQGKTLLERVQTVERNQIRVMIKLGIEPQYSADSGVFWPWEAAAGKCRESNSGNLPGF